MLVLSPASAGSGPGVAAVPLAVSLSASGSRSMSVIIRLSIAADDRAGCVQLTIGPTAAALAIAHMHARDGRAPARPGKQRPWLFTHWPSRLLLADRSSHALVTRHACSLFEAAVRLQAPRALRCSSAGPPGDDAGASFVAFAIARPKRARQQEQSCRAQAAHAWIWAKAIVRCAARLDRTGRSHRRLCDSGAFRPRDPNAIVAPAGAA